MLESAQLPKSGARRGIWNLEGLSRFLESAQLPKPGTKRVIWNLDGPSRVLGNSFVYSRIWAAPRPQLNGTVCPAPPGAFEPIPLHSFFFFASCGNSESWKVETAITLPVVCTFPAREMPLQRCKAIAGHFAPGARNGLARARVRRAPRAARHRLGARSHPRRTG